MPMSQRVLCLASLLTLACTVPNPNAGSDESSESGSSESSASTETSSGSEDADEGSESAGTETGGCQDDELECAGECVDPQSNDDHCGACDTPCGEGWNCDAGGCIDTRQWGEALRVDDNDLVAASDHRVAVAASGDAYVTWSEYNDSTLEADLRVARLPLNAAEWGAPEQVGTVDGGPASHLDVATDGVGDALVIWRDDQVMAPQEAVLARRWSAADQMWEDASTPAAVDSLRGPTLVTNASESAAIAWVELSTPPTLRATRWDPVTGAWLSPETLDAGSGQQSYDPSSIRLTGHDDQFHAMCFETDQLAHRLVSLRYTPSNGWSAANPASALNEELKSEQGLQVDDEDGQHLAVWRQETGRGQSLQAAVLESSQLAWGESVVLDVSAQDTVHDLHFDYAHGVAVAVWDEDDGSRRGVWTTRFDGSWETPVRLETDTDTEAFHARVLADDAGHMLALWFHDTISTGGQVRARQWHRETGWTPERTVAVIPGEIVDIRLAKDASGRILATWEADGEVWAVWFE